MVFIKVSKKKLFDVNRGSKKWNHLCAVLHNDHQSKRVMNHFSPLSESMPLQAQPPRIPPNDLSEKKRVISTTLRQLKWRDFSDLNCSSLSSNRSTSRWCVAQVHTSLYNMTATKNLIRLNADQVATRLLPSPGRGERIGWKRKADNCRHTNFKFSWNVVLNTLAGFHRATIELPNRWSRGCCERSSICGLFSIVARCQWYVDV